jgi:LysM repeat protein
MEPLIDEAIAKIKAHPIVAIIMVAAVLYVIYVLVNRKNTATATNVPTATTGPNVAPPETISQTFNSYPITSTVAATPVKKKTAAGVPPPPVPVPPQPSPKQPAHVSARYVTVTPWPTQNSTLWGISQANGMSLATIEALNPQITNPNLIYPGQQVRIA